MIPSFKEFLNEKEITNKILLFEHIVYKNIPNTKNSYRQDTGNTNNMTLTHSHIFAKRNGQGKELYSVNIDGSGHDGSSGIEISTKQADFFRNKGYDIKTSNILESLNLNSLNYEEYELIIITDTKDY